MNFRSFYISILLIISLYFVIGAIADIIIKKKFEYADTQPIKYVFDGNQERYRNISQMKANEEYEIMKKFYPFSNKYGDVIWYLFNLICFGLLGSIIRILVSRINNVKLNNANFYYLPILGGILGLLMVVLSELLPEFENKSGNNKFYYSLALLCGIYTKEFFSWLNLKWNSIFKTS